MNRITTSQETSVPGDRARFVLSKLGSDGVAVALEMVAVLGVLSAIVAGVLLFIAGEDEDRWFGVGFALAGAVQSLILLGFSRLIANTHSTAMLQAQNAVLLHESVYLLRTAVEDPPHTP